MWVKLQISDTSGIGQELSDHVEASQVEKLDVAVLRSGGQQGGVHRMKVDLQKIESQFRRGYRLQALFPELT